MDELKMTDSRGADLPFPLLRRGKVREMYDLDLSLIHISEPTRH